MKILKIALITLVSLLLLTVMVGYFFLKSTIPVIEGVMPVTGIRRPLDIIRNQHGVPFIKAENAGDLFFAFGFVHAQDRLFQMDCQRRAAFGRLSEIFGAQTLAQDIWQKYLLTEKGINKTYLGLKAENKKLLECYCRGVNCFLATQNLPPEFHLLNYEPEIWQVKDILAVLKYLETALLTSGGELSHERLLAALPAEQARKFLAGPWPDSFAAGSHLPQNIRGPMLTRLLSAERINAATRNRGSAWAVSGSKTVSGLPLLAADFVWPPQLPVLFYQVIGKTPHNELSGNTIPGIPYIFSGRNRQLGWGITAATSDTLDYFFLTIHPRHDDWYRFNGRWQKFRVREMKIGCRGRQDYILKMRLANFGPVISEDGCQLAVQSLVQECSSTPEALLQMNLARNHREFAAAMSHLSAPVLRVVFADRKGNIGACAPGRMPLRGKGDGSLPVRAEAGTDRWCGFVENAEKKIILNPDKGWVSMADLEFAEKTDSAYFKFEPVPDFLGERIAELLNNSAKLDLEALIPIQNDTLFKNAEFLVGKIKKLPLTSAGAKFVQSALTAWDFNIGEGTETALFFHFERNLSEAIFATDRTNGVKESGIPSAWIYRWLDYPLKRDVANQNFEARSDDRGANLRETFAAAVEKSLRETYETYLRETKDNVDNWRWENLHTVHFSHPLGGIFVLKPFFERGTLAGKGGKYCLLNSDFVFGNHFETTRTAAYKMIVDFADFSNSALVYAAGQSGHPLSPFYDDQIAVFSALKYLKMERLGKRVFFLRLIPETPTKRD